MERIEFVFKALKNLAWSLLLQGALLILLGILIYIYPSLLIVLAAVFFILTGLVTISIGLKVKKYSKIKVDF